MSRRPIARSPDLLRLQNEGYDIEVRGGYLLVSDIPYVNSGRVVQRGALVCKLELTDDVANKPSEHTAYWIGEHPCHSDGSKITAFENPSPPQDLGQNIFANFMFSAKADYRDYHHKVTTYVGRIEGEANKLEEASAMTFPVIPTDEDTEIFRYVDTASSRAGIGAVNDKMAGNRIAIVGLGGTGAYVLDLIAKTPVTEIHLFDGDVFSQHNAFRCPGAPSGEQLSQKPSKIQYLFEIYDRMRRGIHLHNEYLSETNVSALDDMDFVFLSLDSGPAKRVIVERLSATGKLFIDVGLGVVLNDGMLSGIVRLTTVTPQNREKAGPHISFADGNDDGNEYATNIQIAELNALNATLAVIRWKKLCGVYRDATNNFYEGYSIATGTIVTEGDE